MVIAVDFDGTIVKDKWPKIGKFRLGAKWVMKWMIKHNHILILNTCREERLLLEAVYFLFSHGIRFEMENANIYERIKEYGSDCRKISADLYIDDRGIGYWNWPMVFITVLTTDLKERLFKRQYSKKPATKISSFEKRSPVMTYSSFQ